MVQFNLFRKEINCKIVYYGPPLAGIVENIEMVQKKIPQEHRGDVYEMLTEAGRVFFLEITRMEQEVVPGIKTKLRLCTYHPNSFWRSLRKLLLQGVDGVIFVANSQKKWQQENLEFLKELENILEEHGIDIQKMPLVMQWNNRNSLDVLSVEELEKDLNYLKAPSFQAVSSTGEGVLPTLEKCVELVVESVQKEDYIKNYVKKLEKEI